MFIQYAALLHVLVHCFIGVHNRVMGGCCRVLVSPVVQGAELLPGQQETRPLLFVGNLLLVCGARRGRPQRHRGPRSRAATQLQ